jgi:hypothetical protein
MKPAKKPARNAPCPCGSGKKYKQCCANATYRANSRARLMLALVAAALAAALLFGIMSVVRSGDSRLPGRVWSPEHGHWHEGG